MKFSPSTVRAFKQVFHGNREATFQIYSKDKSTEPEIVHGTLTPTVLTTLKARNQEGATICMMINRGDGKGRKAENVKKVTSLFIDSDGTCERSVLMNAPIKPHMVVITSPNRGHAYWLVKDVPPDQFKPLQTALARKFNTDASVCDRPRVMRVPGTINWSHGEPYLVKISHHDTDAKPIPLKKFLRRMGLIAPQADANAVRPASACPESIVDLIKRIEEALPKISADERQTWLTVGMAIHSVLPTEHGYAIWTKWSCHGSNKYDAADQLRTWAGFKADGGTRIGTLFQLAANPSGRASATDVNVVAPSGTEGVTASDELELAELFVSKHGHQLRCVESEKGTSWYIWTGIPWKKSNNAVHQLAREFSKASTVGEQGKRIGTTAAIRSILGHACTIPAIQARPRDFDSIPNLLAVRNGVIELATGTFREALPTDMVERAANVEFDGNATCPRWMQFLNEVTKGDRELATFLQLAVGYSLWGHTKEQIFFIIIGDGANGKGVFMRAIYSLLDEYALTVPGSMLNKAYGNASSVSPAVAKINKRRYLMCTEVPKRPLDEAFVKSLSGSDPLSGRGLYADQQEFVPVAKLWLSVNQMPPVRFEDDAMWRRIVPIPFEARFIGRNSDSSLEEKLAKEMPGILNWAVAGAMKYAAGGLPLCKKSRVLRKRLRKGVDTVGEWLSSECNISTTAEIQAAVAYQSYSEHLRRQKSLPLNMQEFKATMKTKGFAPRRTKRYNVYRGLRLRDGR